MGLKDISPNKLEQARTAFRMWKSATIPAEKDASKRALDKFLNRYNLTLGDIDPDANNRTIRPERIDELDLLLTILVSVNPYTRYTTDKVTLDVKCDLDDEDYKEVLSKYAYFIKLWRVEKELLKTSFHSKHKAYFKADPYAQKKWRPRNTPNESIQKFKTEADEANREWLRMQQDFATGKVSEKSLIKDVVNSQDRVKITAFNTSRAHMLEQILLPADYLKNSKTIDDGNRNN